jgi:hypothetical protein
MQARFFLLLALLASFATLAAALGGEYLYF